MDKLAIVTLAFTQGLTEFFPISSSAHLILVPYWFGWPDQGLAFDVAVHLGTLLAVIVYFRARVAALLRHPFGDFSRLLVLATLPALVIGAGLHDDIDRFRSPLWIALWTASFGLLLGYADWRGNKTRILSALSLRHGLIIGCAQAMALLPGVSRSGITITAALWLGYTRRASAEFSFLLSMPVIAAAGCYTGAHLWFHAIPVDIPTLCWGASIAFFSAYICIHTFFLLLDRISLQWFVLYRCVLALILLIQLA